MERFAANMPIVTGRVGALGWQMLFTARPWTNLLPTRLLCMDVQGFWAGRCCSLLGHGAVCCQHACCGRATPEGPHPLPQHLSLVQSYGLTLGLPEGQK